MSRDPLSYSRRGRPSLWRQVTDMRVPAGPLARAVMGFLLGAALCALLLVLGLLVLGVWALIELGPLPGLAGIAGLVCLGCALFAVLG